MLYIRILEKILNERDVKRSAQYAQLVRSCESTIHDIRTTLKENHVPLKGESVGESGESGVLLNNNDYENKGEKSVFLTSSASVDEYNDIHVDSEKYFSPLELATKGDCPKITILALDGIQKLIAHGHLTGNYPNLANANKRLIDTIVETICSCFNGAETDEGVELQIIKALLTVVTSQYVQIHEGSVLLILRTCFNIYLLTKNPINQTTSRAMLTQMLQSIFTRMEIAYEGLTSDSLSKIDTGITNESLEKVTELVENWDRESFAWFNLLDLSFFYTRVNCNQSLISSYSADEALNHNANSENVNSESEFNNNQNNDGDSVEQQENIPCNADSPSILQKDAFLVFWAVCKMSSNAKPNLTEETDPETRKVLEQKSTILSFQLVKSVLQNCGPVFQSSSMFHTAIKQYLCTALKETGVSSNQDIYQLNLDLLVILIDKFQNAISNEIEKLLDDILFPVMENPIAFSNEYKLLGLKTMNRIYNSLKSLTDLFLRQETEHLQHSSFERMINYTCKLTHSEKYVGDTGFLSALPIRMLAIESICSLLQKMNKSLEKKKDNLNNYTSEIIVSSCSSLEINDEETLSNTKVNMEEKEEAFKNPACTFVSSLLEFLETSIPNPINTLEIDSLIQTNAQHFYENGNFGDNLQMESADAFYTLIYSSISLIGELSSKQGKRRVNKEWFVKFNLSATDNKWYQMLPGDFLELVFNEIDAYLKQQVVKHRKHQNTTSQPLNVVHNAQKLITALGLHQSPIFYERRIRCIKKMFKIMGKSVLNALMGTLIIYDDATVTDLCLTALQCAIHISAVLNLKNERDAYVQALARLSLSALKEIKDKTAKALVVSSRNSSITTTENGVTKTIITTTTETKCRNVDIILTLLNVGINEGNHLASTWLDTLKCISTLEASELMRKRNDSHSSRTPSFDSNNSEDNKNSTSWYAWAGSLVPTFWDNSGTKLDMASVKQSVDASVNRIFQNSIKLDENGIVDFFKALCQVSLIEITHPENPRSFVYEKIFQVAHININRPCLQWCGIWQVLSDFFSHLACSSDEEVSFFAIDSITKLVVHLLEKETFGNFRFQSYFLKPYQTVMQNTPFLSTREYVLGSIAKIVRINASQLRSGWIPIFSILESSVFHDSPNTAEVSFSMLKNILHMFTESEVNLQSSYPELLKSLTELSFKGPTKQVQTDSFQMIQTLANLVHNRPELFIASDLSTIQQAVVWRGGWLPIFKELSSVVIDSEKYAFTHANQANALTILFDLIKVYGDSFHASWWQSLFGILFNIFNKLKFQNGEDAILADATPNHCKGFNQFYCFYYTQFAIIDIFIRHFDTLGKMLMEKLLKELEWCIRQDHDQIALSGVQCLHQLIKMLQKKMCASDWNLITTMLYNLLQINTPPIQNNDYKWNPVVQLELLKVAKTILIPSLDSDSIKEIEDVSTENNTSTEDNQSQTKSLDTTNSSTPVGDDNLFLLLDALDTRISVIIMTKIEQDSNTHSCIQITTLQLQETLLMDTFLRFVVKMYFEKSWSNDDMDKIETRFITSVKRVLECFVKVQPSTPKNHIHDLNTVLTTCIHNLHYQLSPEKFASFASLLYPNLCDLIDLELEPSLSTSLAKYFLAMLRLKIEDMSSSLSP